MKNAVNCDKLLTLSGYTFKFIRAVSNTVLDMINAVYHNNPLIPIKAMFREKLVSHHRAVNEGRFSHCIGHDKCRLSQQSFDSY